MAELMRFRLPAGWTIGFKTRFYDVDPVYGDDGSIINWDEGFVEDVLWMLECRLVNGEFRCPATECMSIDIHWSGGHYTTNADLHISRRGQLRRVPQLIG